MFKRLRDPNRPPTSIRRVLLKLLLMALIFLAGGVSGALYGVNFSFSQMRYHAEHPEELPDNAIPRLADKLSLSPAQLPEFDRIFRKFHAEIAGAEGENAIRVHQIFYEMGKEILPLLDETHATEFREIHRKICTVFLPPLPKNPADLPLHHPCEDL